jgi:hypothetical protein
MKTIIKNSRTYIAFILIFLGGFISIIGAIPILIGNGIVFVADKLNECGLFVARMNDEDISETQTTDE